MKQYRFPCRGRRASDQTPRNGDWPNKDERAHFSDLIQSQQQDLNSNNRETRKAKELRGSLWSYQHWQRQRRKDLHLASYHQWSKNIACIFEPQETTFNLQTRPQAKPYRNKESCEAMEERLKISSNSGDRRQWQSSSASYSRLMGLQRIPVRCHHRRLKLPPLPIFTQQNHRNESQKA